MASTFFKDIFLRGFLSICDRNIKKIMFSFQELVNLKSPCNRPLSSKLSNLERSNLIYAYVIFLKRGWLNAVVYLISNIQNSAATADQLGGTPETWVPGNTSGQQSMFTNTTLLAAVRPFPISISLCTPDKSRNIHYLFLRCWFANTRSNLYCQKYLIFFLIAL